MMPVEDFNILQLQCEYNSIFPPHILAEFKDVDTNDYWLAQRLPCRYCFLTAVIMARGTAEVLWVQPDCVGLFEFSQSVKQPQGILDCIQHLSLDTNLGYPLFLALLFACLTAQWWESRIFDYKNLFLHRCHLFLQLCVHHSNIFLGYFSLTTVSS